MQTIYGRVVHRTCPSKFFIGNAHCDFALWARRPAARDLLTVIPIEGGMLRVQFNISFLSFPLDITLAFIHFLRQICFDHEVLSTTMSTAWVWNKTMARDFETGLTLLMATITSPGLNPPCSPLDPRLTSVMTILPLMSPKVTPRLGIAPASEGSSPVTWILSRRVLEANN